MNLQRLIDKYCSKVRSPLTGIRAFCVSCMGGYVNMVTDCPSVRCPLYKFRMGKNTLHKLGRENRTSVQPSSVNQGLPTVPDHPKDNQEAA